MKYLIMLLTLSACTTTKYVVQNVDTEMQIKGAIDGKQVGLNSKNEIIIQSVTDIVGELKGQEIKNYNLLDKTSYKRDELIQCKKELASPVLGGNGMFTDVPDLDIEPQPVITEYIGKDKNDSLEVVKREFYIQKLSAERAYGDNLNLLNKQLNKLVDRCNIEMSHARVTHGFPSNKYSGVGHFTEDGHWITDRKAEHNLDDAIEIRGLYGKQ